MKRQATFLLSAAAFVFAQNAQAQAYNDPDWTDGSVPVPSWVLSPSVGDGVDRFDEASTSTQGGDPPALAYEPAAIDENGTYTRSEWIGGGASRIDEGAGKARFTCNVSHFAEVDPIIYSGVAPAGHHHTFIGNKGTDENSDYDALRTSPASSCAGGPLNATAYWEPTVLYEVETGIYVPVKPNLVTFYYRAAYADAPKLYRLPRGFAFIGGANPADRLNVAGLAEIPSGVLSDGTTWKKTGKRYNGWAGWACVNGSTAIPLAVGNTADVETANYARQLVNEDGTDPWDGACEDSSYALIANLTAPGCWDGHNLTSPTGRGHVRYAIVRNQAQSEHKCPDGWWQVPTLEAKVEFPNGHGAIAGHAWRSKLHLSSDEYNPSTGMMDPDPANWQPRGSTFHFDWMNGWDSVIMETWLINCVGVSIDSTTYNGNPLTCNDSTISATEKMITLSASPDPALSNDPPITFHTYYNDPAADAFGAIETGTVVDATVTHTH